MALQFKPEEYKTHIRISAQKHLLVEGKNDKYLFKLFLDNLRIDQNLVVIDSAEDLIQFDCNLGNRERVETVCQAVCITPWAKQLVGFVDREFREFEINENDMFDRIPQHNVVGSVVWSRGHSVENYYFNFEMLNAALEIYSPPDYMDEALSLLKRNLENVIRYACAASMAGRD